MKQIILTLTVLGCAVVAARAQSHTSELHVPLHLTAALISGGGIGNPTGTARVEITISRWSTTDERVHLLKALADDGQDALLAELQKAKSVGTIRVNTQLAWDLRYARATPRDEGGTRVLLATDRPMSAWEIWNDPRYSQYPFTLVNLDFDRDGQAMGSLLLAARVTSDSDGRFVNVENFATQPVTMTQIKIER